LPIVSNVDWIAHQPILKIDQHLVREVLRTPARKLRFGPSIILLEAYLQITDSPNVTLEFLVSGGGDGLFEGVAGALNSQKFMDTRRAYLRCNDVLSTLELMGMNPASNLRPLTSFLAASADRLADRFERAPLNTEQVWVKQGWGVETSSGRTITFPLYPIYRRLGREKTERLCELLAAHYRNKRAQWPQWLPAFVAYVENSPLQPEFDNFLLDDAVALRAFLNGFGRTYIQDAALKGLSIPSRLRIWNSTFVPAIEFLVERKFLPSMEPPLSRIFGHRVSTPGRATNIKKCGLRPVKTGLLTDIPLEVTDVEAKDLLFAGIVDDLGAVLTWAERDAGEIWRRYCCSNLAKAKSQNYRTGDEQDASNADNATFRTTPFGARGVVKGSASSSDKRGAFALGIPINGSLLAHAALLVGNHPEITTAFLDDLELYSKDGAMVGLVEIDGVSLLVGYKRRRGSVLAQQKIRLLTNTRRIVDQVIALTEPLRRYLRSTGSDDWRYLFLTTASLKSKPKKQKFSDQCSFEQKFGLEGLVSSFRHHLDVETSISKELVARFSLKALRGSSAINVFFKNGSVSEMSQALGHATYQPKLLDHYLPDSIQAFFRDRWVRIFQEGIVCEALKDSEYLLEASSFSSMETLDKFLTEHALKVPRFANVEENNRKKHHVSSGSVLFNISPRVLAPLISLANATTSCAESCSGTARYWTTLCEHLVDYIQTQSDRPDLQRCLDEARRLASSGLLRGVEL
jgi:hypothetical protein